MKSLDKVEYLRTHLLLNFHPLVAGFPGSGNCNQSSHALPPFKRKKKGTADFSVNIQTGHFCNWLRAPDVHMGTRKGVAQMWGHGNISKGNEASRRM